MCLTNLDAFLAILEDIPVKIFRGSMPPNPSPPPPEMASANELFLKLTPLALISFSAPPPPPPQTKICSAVPACNGKILLFSGSKKL